MMVILQKKFHRLNKGFTHLVNDDWEITNIE